MTHGDPFYGGEAEQRETRHPRSPSSSPSSPHHLDIWPGAGLGRLGEPGTEFRGEFSRPRAQRGGRFPSPGRGLGGASNGGGRRACAECDRAAAALRMRQPPGGGTGV